MVGVLVVVDQHITLEGGVVWEVRVEAVFKLVKLVKILLTTHVFINESDNFNTLYINHI